MKNGKLRIIVGIILVLLQVVGVLGLEEIYLDLWDTKENTFADYTAEPTELTLTMWCHGFYTGRVKWVSVFKDLPEALAEEDFYFHETTSAEFLSARIRDGLAVGEQYFQRVLYDLNLWVGFYLFGILGAVLLVSGILAWRRREYAEDGGYIDILDGKLAAKLRIPGAVICWGCLALQLPGEAGLPPENIFPLVVYGCMGVFFGFYYGKKSSVLPVAALLIWGAVRLEAGLYSFIPMVTASTETQLVYYFLRFVLFTIAGILFLICGGKLYRNPTKKKLKWLFTVAGAAELLFYVYYISEFRKFPRLMIRELIGHLPAILFLLLMGVYIWLVKDRLTEKEVVTPERESVPEGACHMCRAPLGQGKTHCSRCGALIPVKEVSTETAAPIVETAEPAVQEPEAVPNVQEPAKPLEVKFCTKCGKPVAKGSRFCSHCGAKVWQPAQKTGITE